MPESNPNSTRPRTLPLRTAIIGLSANATTSWAATAHLPALLHPHGRRLYNITALCNSSVAAAHAAIEAFSLPPTTKAYGSPDDVARDPDIDFVICCTRVDRHFEGVLDSIRAGKDVFVEWPVTSSVKDTEVLIEEMRKGGGRVVVGLQGRWAPPVVRVREILEEGKWGRVLSSEVRAFGGTINRDRVPTGLKYFGEKSVGGNVVTIGFGHLIDYIQSVVGRFVEGTTQAKTQIQIPKNKAFDPKTKEVVEEFESDVPDLIVVTGSLPESKTVIENATLSVKLRRGPPFKGEPSLTWTINCERGEIRLIVPSGMSLQADAYAEPISLQVHDLENDVLVEESWNWSKEQEEIPVRARSIMRTLFAFAEGDESGFVSLESAAITARQIDTWLR